MEADRDRRLNPPDPPDPAQVFPALHMSVFIRRVLTSAAPKSSTCTAQCSSAAAAAAERLPEDCSHEEEGTDEGLPGDKTGLFKH